MTDDITYDDLTESDLEDFFNRIVSIDCDDWSCYFIDADDELIVVEIDALVNAIKEQAGGPVSSVHIQADGSCMKNASLDLWGAEKFSIDFSSPKQCVFDYQEDGELGLISCRERKHKPLRKKSLVGTSLLAKKGAPLTPIQEAFKRMASECKGMTHEGRKQCFKVTSAKL